jgi:hypothetical protein
MVTWANSAGTCKALAMSVLSLKEVHNDFAAVLPSKSVFAFSNLASKRFTHSLSRF